MNAALRTLLYAIVGVLTAFTCYKMQPSVREALITEPHPERKKAIASSCPVGFASPEVSFGNVAPGQLLKWEHGITNKTSQAYKILSIEECGGCSIIIQRHNGTRENVGESGVLLSGSENARMLFSCNSGNEMGWHGRIVRVMICANEHAWELCTSITYTTVDVLKFENVDRYRFGKWDVSISRIQLTDGTAFAPHILNERSGHIFVWESMGDDCSVWVCAHAYPIDRGAKSESEFVGLLTRKWGEIKFGTPYGW